MTAIYPFMTDSNELLLVIADEGEPHAFILQAPLWETYRHSHAEMQAARHLDDQRIYAVTPNWVPRTVRDAGEILQGTPGGSAWIGRARARE